MVSFVFMKTLLILLLAFTWCLPAAAEKSPQEEALAGTLLAFFLSQNREYVAAAQLFADVGNRHHLPDLLREASSNSIYAKNIKGALAFAEQWENLGGGAPAMSRQAQIHIRSGNFIRAEQVLSRLAQNNHLDDDKLYSILTQTVDKKQAAAIGGRLFSTTPKGRELFAKIAMTSGDWELTREIIDNAPTVGKEAAVFYLLRAKLADLENKTPAAALAELEKSIAQQCAGWADGCSEASLLHAYRLFEQGRNEWSKPLYSPTEVARDSALQAAEFLEFLAQTVRAVKHYEEVKPYFFRARLGLARIAGENKNLRGALAILDESSVANDREFSLREITAADFLSELGDGEGSLARLAQARRVSPQNSQLMYHQAMEMEKQNDIDGAISVLREMTKVHPRRPDSWNALGYIMADHHRNLAEAKEFIQRALALDDKDPNILDSMGWVLYRQGNLKEALAYILRAAKQSDAAEIAAHLGEIYWHLGDQEQALKILRQAASQHPNNKVLNETIGRLQIEI